MKVYVNSITGIDDAIVSMYMSKRSWTRETEMKIRSAARVALTHDGTLRPRMTVYDKEAYDFFVTELNKLVKWGARHITMLRFIDISITVEGIHRAGQDDIDSHAARFNNRIIRSSTRLANFTEGEVSEYYEDKIVPTDVALAYLGIETPNEIEYKGNTYVKGVNGYILKGMENNKDVKRGLYMLSIPSNFIMKIQLTEFAHVYKERNESGTANPEVKTWCETTCDLIEETIPMFTRELYNKIPN